MNVNEAFPSKYLSAADLAGRPATVRMGEVTKEILDREEKLILSLQGKRKTMVLNKTNAMKIAEMHGSETNDWYDKVIELYATETDYAGKTVDAIRVRAPRTENRDERQSETRREPQRETQREPQREMANADDRGGERRDERRDERPRDPPPRREEAPQRSRADMDDDIPF